MQRVVEANDDSLVSAITLLSAELADGLHGGELDVEPPWDLHAEEEET